MDINSATAKTSSVASLPLGLGTPQPQAQPQAKVPVKAEAQPQPNQNQERPITEKELQSAIQDVANSIAESNLSIGFNYEQKLGQLFVKITDSVSGEVIREVPSEDFIKHKIAMREMIGLLLDKEA